MRAPSLAGRKEIIAQRRRLKRKYKALYGQVNDILFRHDPIRIALQHNEYEPEVGRILARADVVRSIDELTGVIHSVFVEMFDSPTAGDHGRYEPIARELWPLIRP